MSCCFWNQSVQSLSHVRLFVTSWTAARQVSLSITNLQCCSNSCPLSQWCHPIISSSVVPFFSCLQSLPASGSFPVSQFFTSGGQSIGASASVLPMNIQDWFPLGLTGLISLQFKGLSRIFSQHHILKASILLESALAYLLFYRVRAGTGWRGRVPYCTAWVSIFDSPSHFLGFYMTICSSLLYSRTFHTHLLGLLFPSPPPFVSPLPSSFLFLAMCLSHLT